MYLILLVMTLLQSVCFGLRTDFIDGWSCGTIPSQGGRDFVGAESTGSCLEGDAHTILLRARSWVRGILQIMRCAGDGATDNPEFAPVLSPLRRVRHQGYVPLALASATFLGAVSGNLASGLGHLLGEGTNRLLGVVVHEVGEGTNLPIQLIKLIQDVLVLMFLFPISLLLFY